MSAIIAAVRTRKPISLHNPLDRLKVQALMDDAANQQAELTRRVPLPVMNERERALINSVVADATKRDVLSRIYLQPHSPLELSILASMA